MAMSRSDQSSNESSQIYENAQVEVIVVWDRLPVAQLDVWHAFHRHNLLQQQVLQRRIQLLCEDKSKQ